MDYSRLIRFKTGKKGDISPLLKNKKAFAQVINDLVSPFSAEKIDLVAGVEARGFIFAGAVAYLLGTGLVMVRKGGKLPCKVVSEICVDYSGRQKVLEIPADAIKKGQKVLIIDDWIETGAQSKGSAAMIEKLGGIIVGFATVVDSTSEETRKLFSKYRYHFLVRI